MRAVKLLVQTLSASTSLAWGIRGLESLFTLAVVVALCIFSVAPTASIVIFLVLSNVS